MANINMMQFISTTELKNNTKSVLDLTNELGEIFIMNNNKPKVVMISVEHYNYLSSEKNNFRIVGDIIPMSESDEKSILESRENYKKGEFITEEELFSKLLN